jgi:AraC family transcriptional regulator
MNTNSLETTNSVRGLSQRLSPSLRLTSSLGLGWKNIVVERHLVKPGEKPALTVSHHVVNLASGSKVAYGERRSRSGQFIAYSKPPGTLLFYSEGSLPVIHQKTETELIVCALDPAFVRQVAEELADGSTVNLQQPIEFRDESAAKLIRLLEMEAASGAPSNSLYVDYLAHALTLRLLSSKTTKEDQQTSRNRLPIPCLRRVVERMEADLTADLNLKVLATESGYSRNHFLRMFRAATGFTPHQYLIRLRIKKAQTLMTNRSLGLIDIALTSGFSSHAHLSRVFRQIVGSTPSEYRRTIV